MKYPSATRKKRFSGSVPEHAARNRTDNNVKGKNFSNIRASSIYVVDDAKVSRQRLTNKY